MKRRRNLLFLVLVVASLSVACASLPREEPAGRPLSSPGEYLARGLREVAAADALRREKSSSPMMGGVFASPRDMEKWLLHLRRAESDFQAVLDRFPGSPEAAQAQFQLGWIEDHPHRNRFDEALARYRRTIDRFPGTPAAENARKRIELIESIRN